MWTSLDSSSFRLCVSWAWMSVSFPRLVKFSDSISSNKFSVPFSPFSACNLYILYYLRGLLNYPSFFSFFHFSVQLGYFHILCLPDGWSCSPISFKPLLIPFSVFFISVMVLFRFSLCSSILLPSLVSIFIIITLKFLLGRLLISNSFSSVSEVVSHPLIWTYSSLLFCLML